MTLHRVRARRAAPAVLAGLLAIAGCAGSPADPAGSSGPAGSAGPAGSSGGAGEVRANGQTGWRGTPVRRGYPLPEQEFTDTAGRTVVPARDADSPVTLVFFGYTHCPDVCNIVLASTASALRGSSDEVRAATRLLFVTTDPARDTAPVLREYLDRFDPTYDGLIAPVPTVEQAARDLFISYERPDGSTGGYEVEHGTYTTAFVDGRARLVWSAGTSVADLRADLARLTRLASRST